jgi:hypothetical protein
MKFLFFTVFLTIVTLQANENSAVSMADSQIQYQKNIERGVNSIKNNLKKDLSKRMSLGYIIAVTAFSSIGFVAFMAGKRRKLFKPMLYGLALIAFPYFITNIFWMYVVGIGLTLTLYYDRD